MDWKAPETRAKLLMAIFATQGDDALSGAKAAKIAEYMGCTAKAVTHQLTALRKDLAEFKASNGQVAPTSAKKRKAKSNDADGSESPTKKSKPTPKKGTAKKAKKVEEVDRDESQDDSDDAVAARKEKAEGNGDAINEDDDSSE